MTPTTLQIVNGTDDVVDVCFTLRPGPGHVGRCRIPFLSPVSGNPRQGVDTLAAYQSLPYTPPEEAVLAGTLCFGKRDASPRGAAVNLFRFVLNPEHGDEAVDVDCVAGVNALLRVSMSGGGVWNAGRTQPWVTEFHNERAGSNTGLVGVFPVGCDACTARVRPTLADTAAPPERPQAVEICTVRRPVSAAGGAVTVTFLGFA